MASNSAHLPKRPREAQSPFYDRLQLQQQPYRRQHADLRPDGDIIAVRQDCRRSYSPRCAGNDRRTEISQPTDRKELRREERKRQFLACNHHPLQIDMGI